MVDLLDLRLSRTHAQAHRHAGRHACTQTHTRALTHFCTFFFLSLSHKSLFLSLEKLERKDIAIVSLLLQTHEQTSSKYLTVYSPSIDREGNVTNRRFWGIAPKEHKTAVFHSGLVYFLVYIYSQRIYVSVDVSRSPERDAINERRTYIHTKINAQNDQIGN